MDRERLDLEPHVNLVPLQEEMERWRILVIVGEDILRWGHSPQGTFNTREAYRLRAPSDPLLNTKI
jgi:hypothetical protein